VLEIGTAQVPLVAVVGQQRQPAATVQCRPQQEIRVARRSRDDRVVPLLAQHLEAGAPGRRIPENLWVGLECERRTAPDQPLDARTEAGLAASAGACTGCGLGSIAGF